MPREPPVTRATLPESFFAIGSLRCSKLFEIRWPSGYAVPFGIEIETIETHCFQLLDC
jgi:hypothetical protein